MAASTSRPARRPRGSLQRDEIVTAAVGVVEADGVAELTMTAVAQAVGAPVTSVYWHFRTRDALLDAVAERVNEDFYALLPVPNGHGSWQDELVAYWNGFREQLLRHPAFLDLLTSRFMTVFANPRIGRLVTDRLEQELSILTRAGAAPEDAYRIFTVFSNYVRGFVVLELAWAREDAPLDARETIALRHGALDTARHPVMGAIPAQSLLWADTDHHFRYGLGLLVEAAAIELGTPAREPSRKRASRRAGN